MAVPPRKSDYEHSGAHIVPVGPMSASGADRATCWGTQEVFDKWPPAPRTVTFPYAQREGRPKAPDSVAPAE